MSQEHNKISRTKLKAHFKLHGQRAEGMRMLMNAIIQSESVNLKQCAKAAQSNVLTESTEKRFKRFLKEVELNPKEVALFMVDLLGLNMKNKKYTLIFDRTYWPFGKTHINLLVLSIIHEHTAIPLFFSFLGEEKEPDEKGRIGKKGNSSFLERRQLLEQYILLFGKESIEVLLGDREFIGYEWNHFLTQEKIPHIMRAKDRCLKIQNRKEKMVMLNQYAHRFSFHQPHHLGERTLGVTLPFQSHVSLLRLPPDVEKEMKKSTRSKGAKNGRNKTNLRIKKEADLTGNLPHFEDEIIVLCHCGTFENVFELYRTRWKIETLFRTLKTGGFHIEDVSLKAPKRIIVLMQLAMIVSAVSIKVGLASHEIKPILVKKHGYKEETLVKRGIREIQLFLHSYKGTLKMDIDFDLIQKRQKIRRSIFHTQKPPDIKNAA